MEQGFYHAQKGYWQGAPLAAGERPAAGVSLVPLIPGPDNEWAWNGSIWIELPPPPVTAEEARAQRNTLLAASDWTQVADAPVDQAAWATYRQALRDITVQAGFPEAITWPVQPV